MVCRSTQSSAASWVLLTMVMAASWEERIKVAAFTLKENTQHLHPSEAEHIVTTYTVNLQSQNNALRTTLNSSENVFEKKNSELKTIVGYNETSNSPKDSVFSDNVNVLPNNQLKRRSVVTTQPILDSNTFHHKRHNHTRVPTWLKDSIEQLFSHKQIKIETNEIEDGIAAVFREVAYGKKDDGVFRRQSSNTGNRYERTTALSETPDYNYIADESLPIMSGRRKISSNITDPIFSGENVSNVANVEETNNFSISNGADRNSGSVKSNSSEVLSTVKSDIGPSEAVAPNERVKEKRQSVLDSILELEAYDDDLYDIYEGHYSDFYDDDVSKVSRRGDSLFENTSLKSISEIVNNVTQSIDKLLIPRLSWYDYLLCTHRNMAWIIINFLLGLLLLSVSIFAPYRLLTLRACTHILPRTHFVTIHLLVFVAASLKALYMFHLAFGGKERLPLVLILILNNTSIPCFISAYLILIIMMFLTADVQVYKPKFLTMHNISIFIVMMIVLSFAADIIVGSAHSKSVLVLSRIMLIGVAVAVIVFYVRKHPRVIQVVNMLKREFQGELKLLVVPSKDSPQQRQMDIKHILRNRLHSWCRVMKMATIAVAVCCLTHFIHAIFLISSHVPAWAWWSFHASGAVVEAALGVFFCIAAALTQRYNEKTNFIFNLFVPSLVSRNKKKVTSKERNGNVVYQRVSYSSGTESTQYTSCPNDAIQATTAVTSRTPKPPRRRTATVRRSATFSYAPQYPRAPGRPCQPPVPNLNSMRTGSASQIPMYSPGSLSHVSDIYSPASISHVPVYSPSSVKSMLVHEDGFVRIRTQVDPNDTKPRRSGSHIGIHESNQFHRGSNPQIHNANLQQWNGLGSRESFYHCLPRRRRSSRSSSFHQYNSQIAENDYHPGTSGRPQVEPSNLLYQPNQRTIDPNYQSFSRRRHRSRESSLKQLNNIEKEADECNMNRNRMTSPCGLNLQHMNNLDRSEEDYQSLGRRKLSHEDNNEPIYYNSSQEGSYHKLPASKNNVQCSKVSPMNLSDREDVSPLSKHSHSPSIRHKISNVSASPVRHFHSPSPVHSSPVGYSPNTSRREAHYPKPFSHRGSNSSLRSEDIPYLEHYQRTNPVRRNHSSAGYFPSRYLQPADGSMADDTQRYGSLRIGLVKKRQPGYVLHTNTSKLLNKYLDKYPKSASEEDNLRKVSSEYGVPNKVSKGGASRTIEERDDNDCDSSRSAANTSKGNDTDWALELITSSSILTDFYSLKRPKKGNKGED